VHPKFTAHRNKSNKQNIFIVWMHSYMFFESLLFLIFEYGCVDVLTQWTILFSFQLNDTLAGESNELDFVELDFSFYGGLVFSQIDERTTHVIVHSEWV
jgi:hypothetical protein